MVYLTACENKKELELDVRVSIIGVKINGERLRFYADKLGTLKVSKLNKTYDLSKETIDLAPIYEAINEVNSYFEEHKDEVTLKDVDNTQDGGVDATRFVKHIKFGYGKILREEKDLLIIKFDDTADEKKIKYGHPSYEEISLNEYQNRQLADETGAESAARSNWDQYEAALLVEAFWKTEEAPSIKEKILIDLSNKLRRRAINKGVKIDDTFRNVNGMKMQVNKVEAFFYPERPHLNKGGSVLIAACELYKTNRSEFNRILMEAHNQVSGLITNSESDKAGTKEEPYSIALSEVDFYSYIKETYQTKHKEDGKAYRAAAHAQKCIDLIREVNLILTKENFIISDIYKVRSVSDFDKLIAFISRKTRDYEENERKWILSSLTRYRSFIEKDKSQIVSYKKNVMDVFYIKLRSNNIEARMIIESGKYKVLAGSRYSIATGTSFSSSEQEERRHLEKMGVIKNGVFVSDYSFNSSLGAAKQITGNSVSGNVVWKLPNGTTLGQYLADRSDLVKSASESPKQSDTQTSVPSAEEREHKYPDYFNVLKDCFFDGFLYSSQLRRRKFAKAYENINNKEFTDDEATYLRKLKMVGFESDGKIYLIDIVDNKLMEKIKDFIDKNLNHTGAIYYSVLYDNFKEKLNADFSEDMLKEYLKYVFANDYNFESSCITQRGRELDLKQRLIDIFMNSGIPMSNEEIYAKLPMISHDVINTLIKDRDFVVNRRGKSYFYKGIFQIVEEQLDEIKEFLNSQIEKNGQATGAELYTFITSNLPELIESNPKVTGLGIKNVLKLLLASEFSFSGDIISDFGEKIDVKKLYQDFCRERETFDFDELEEYREAIHQTYIDYSAVLDISLRVSKEKFIRRDLIKFDVEKTDDAISNYCIGKYVSLLGIISYLYFPSTNYPWNRFLLEGFLYSKSKKFKLLNKAYNREKPVGAIVRKSAHYDSFDDVVVDILADNHINNKEKAFEYLLDNDFTFTRKFKNIDLLIAKAKAREEV